MIAALICLAYIAGSALASAQSASLIEAPSGPHPIGRVVHHWTNADFHRELIVYLWYPAAQRGNNGNAAYFPGAKEMDAVPDLQRRMHREFGTHWQSIVSGASTSHATDGAPPADDRRRFPVVTFSHGKGSTSFAYTTLIEDLVSHGYVVVAIEHPEISISVGFRAENEPPGLTRDERLKRMMASASAQIERGAQDILFVLDHLQNAADAEKLGLDLKRVAAIGHSAGGAIAARACQLRPSLKACIDLDGAMVPAAALPDGPALRQPFLLLEPHTERAQLFGKTEELQRYFKKKEDQLKTSAPGTYNVVIQSPGIAHPSFSDIPLFFAGTDGYPEIAAIRRNHRLIESFIRAFLDKNLLGQRAPLLDGPDQLHPEATVTRYGR